MKSPFEKFTDILSLTNCSVIIFDSEYSGFLIYGASPFGDSDKAMNEIAN